jgi:hypothetical protein
MKQIHTVAEQPRSRLPIACGNARVLPEACKTTHRGNQAAQQEQHCSPTARKTNAPLNKEAFSIGTPTSLLHHRTAESACRATRKRDFSRSPCGAPCRHIRRKRAMIHVSARWIRPCAGRGSGAVHLLDDLANDTHFLPAVARGADDNAASRRFRIDTPASDWRKRWGNARVDRAGLPGYPGRLRFGHAKRRGHR